MGMAPAAILAAALVVAAPPAAAQPLRPAPGLGAGFAGDMTPASQRRPIPPWVFGRGGEPRLVPPRSIPAGRSGQAAGQAPLPRSRPADPEASRGTTAAAPTKRPMPPRAPGAIDVPVTPLD